MKKKTDKGGESSSSAPLPPQDLLNMSIPRKSRTSRIFVGHAVNTNDQRLNIENDNNVNQMAGEIQEIETVKDEDVPDNGDYQGQETMQIKTDPSFHLNNPRNHNSNKSLVRFGADTYKRAESQIVDLLWDMSGEKYGVPVSRNLLKEAASDIGIRNTGLVNTLLVEMINKSYGDRKFIKGYNQFDGLMFYLLEGPQGEGRLIDNNELQQKLDAANQRILELQTEVEAAAKERNSNSLGSLVSQGNVPGKEKMTVLNFHPCQVAKFIEESDDTIKRMLGDLQVEIVDGRRGPQDKLIIYGPENKVNEVVCAAKTKAESIMIIKEF